MTGGLWTARFYYTCQKISRKISFLEKIYTTMMAVQRRERAKRRTSYSMRLVQTVLLLVAAAARAETGSPFILRVRLPDGSMQRLDVSADPESLLLKDALQPLMPTTSKDIAIKLQNTVLDESQTLSALGLQHGSLITLASTTVKKPATKKPTTQKPSFIPFPELAKDYHSAVRQAQRRRNAGSFADLAHISDNLHRVEPQPQGPLQKISMCATCAEAFATGTSPSALLWGTVHRQRSDAKKARTSLSSTTEETQYERIAKVQAMTDDTSLPDADSPTAKVAEWLDLVPVGWIFRYSEARHEDDGLPVWASDVVNASQWQMHKMQRYDNDPVFVTLAMEASTGATEAFQISDVAVQMVAEGVFDGAASRHVKTNHGVLVDGSETRELDTVLCLVNTAMISHQGLYAGQPSSKKKKNRFLSAKTRKALTKALDGSGDLLKVLCDMNVLVSLYDVLGADDTQALCATVKKWARGQKKGTTVDAALQDKLRSVATG